jgi:hypothetical protein
MGRAALGLLAAVVLTIFAAATAQMGWQGAMHALTHWEYPTIRDMRRSVAILPQKTVTLTPDTLTVPTTVWGDALQDEALATDREAATKNLVNPTPSSDESIARGQKKFMTFCTPCHGTSMAGDGPVAALFMPPTDLLAEATRKRTHGLTFSRRHHGAVIRALRTDAERAGRVGRHQFVRHMQKTSPR